MILSPYTVLSLCFQQVILTVHTTMMQEVISKLIAYYKRDFFTEPILLLTFVFSSVIGLLYNYGQKERILFVIYFFIGTFLFLLASPLEVVLFVAGRKVGV